MFLRLLKLPKNNSFFLFGARGTGKTTLLGMTEFLLLDEGSILRVNLLDSETYDRYLENPSALTEEIHAKPGLRWVIIDEVQRCPEILNLVHLHIEESKLNGKPILFALTGSSARKLRRGKANLLAGRAWLRNLYPLTHLELGNRFDLSSVLWWGGLPQIYSLNTDVEKQEYLRFYAQTYISEEIVAEQIVRDLPPFKKFLRVAAQCNGTIINANKISRDIGCDPKTVQSYFQILEDTYIGYFLWPFHSSVRKRYRLKPKFYFFDLGITRSLAQTISIEPVPSTSAYGVAFEHFFFLECVRLNEYRGVDYTFSFYRTKDDKEIDLVVERPGKPTALIEVKSTPKVDSVEVESFQRLAIDFKKCEAFYVTQDSVRRKVGSILCLHWKDMLLEMFGE